ncbi:hypothetical protein [Rhodococcus sp. NPDC003348]
MTITPALLYRLSGFALVVALAFNLTGGILHPVADDSGHSVAALSANTVPYPQYLLFVGTLLLLLGLPGMYSWVSARAGLPGLVAFVVYFVSSTVIGIAHLAVEAFIAVPLALDGSDAGVLSGTDSIIDTTPFAALMTVSGLGLMIGEVLLGAALWRSRAVPRWIAALMIAGGIVLLIPVPYVQGLSGLMIELPRGLAFAAIGVLMVRAFRASAPSRSATAAGPATAVASAH